MPDSGRTGYPGVGSAWPMSRTAARPRRPKFPL